MSSDETKPETAQIESRAEEKPKFVPFPIEFGDGNIMLVERNTPNFPRKTLENFFLKLVKIDASIFGKKAYQGDGRQYGVVLKADIFDRISIRPTTDHRINDCTLTYARKVKVLGTRYVYGYRRMTVELDANSVNLARWQQTDPGQKAVTLIEIYYDR